MPQASIQARRQWARKFEEAAASFIEQQIVIASDDPPMAQTGPAYAVTLHSAVFAEGRTSDVVGNDRGKNAILLRKDAGPALIMRFTIVKGEEIIRTPDNPVIFMDMPLRPGKKEHEEFMGLLKAWIRSQ